MLLKSSALVLWFATLSGLFHTAQAAVFQSEYKFAAETDPRILTTKPIEHWGIVFAPERAANNTAKLPLLVFLHGNHGTCGQGTAPRQDNSCEYTESGTCEQGYIPSPSHRGYDYVAQDLANRGFIVVSINANRSITCGWGENGDFALNIARGGLILKTIELLKAWDQGTAHGSEVAGFEGNESLIIPNLKDRIDFTRVGLMGHSRGGEGARAALKLFRDPNKTWKDSLAGLNIQSIYEVAPVDGQSGVFNPDGVSWSVLLPTCDGDVSNLQGVRVFDRMYALGTETNKTPKSALSVWGANHNYFNTEWQVSDSRGCNGHPPIFQPNYPSPDQQTILKTVMTDFFTSSILQPSSSISALDPLTPFPRSLSSITFFERSHIPFVSGQDDFWVDPISRKDVNPVFPPIFSHATSDAMRSVREHDSVLQATRLSWNAPVDAAAFMEFSWDTQTQAPRDLSAYPFLELRLSRTESSTTEPQELQIQIVGLNNALSAPVELSHWLTLVGASNGHTLMNMARIPLALFTGVDLKESRGLRLTFPRGTSGKIQLSDVRIRAQNYLPATVDPIKIAPPSFLLTQAQRLQSVMSPRRAEPTSDKVAALTFGAQTTDWKPQTNGQVEITVTSPTRFMPSEDLYRLRLGDVVLSQEARYVDMRQLSQLRFTISQKSADQIARSRGRNLTVTAGEKTWQVSIE